MKPRRSSFAIAFCTVLLCCATFAAQAQGTAPQIGGTPPTETAVGLRYTFQPTASDAEGNALQFSIVNKPAWASFYPSTGRLTGVPQATNVGHDDAITISVNDGSLTTSLPSFGIKVSPWRKASYGHYFAPRYTDTAADAAMLCSQAGVSGVVWRRSWGEIETDPGTYDFSAFDDVLETLAASANPQCQVFLMVEYQSFSTSPAKNPCPGYLQAQYSALNNNGGGAATCFMWDPVVLDAYVAMLKAVAARYDANLRVEGMVFQESALGFSGTHSQDVAAGGTYTPETWRDGLVRLVNECSTAFRRSRCVSFLNFIRGGQKYLADVRKAIAAVPNKRACFSGPDLLPNEPILYRNQSSPYEQLVRHSGCRSNSAQYSSFEVPGCDMDCIFRFGVGGTYGDFPETTPSQGGVCINSYFFWTHRTTKSATGLDWTSALPVIAAYPYGPAWLEQCAGGGGPP